MLAIASKIKIVNEQIIDNQNAKKHVGNHSWQRQR